MNEVRINLPENPTGRVSILAAVSGGADSVALLALLREAARTHPLTLTAAHFEHGIRKEDSLADAAFVRALCAEWEIPLIEGSGNVPEMARLRSMGLEQAAREARYEFLMKARKQAGAQYIALAHHRDDQAETVLMHLLRGSGLRGMAGMKEIDGCLYRPLLHTSKETLVCYLKEWGIPWREDATNQVADNPRNALRLKVIPEMEKIYPGAGRALLRFSEIAAAENAFMHRAAQAFLKEHAARMPFGWLIELHSGGEPWEDVRVLLMRAVNELTGLGQEAVARVVRMWEDPGEARCIHLEGGWRAERGRMGLYLMTERPTETEACIPVSPGVTELKDGLGRLEVGDGAGIPVAGHPFCQELDAQALEGAVIRTRRNGDVIHPLGAPGRQKLSDYFINRKVDRPLRDVIPLIARGNEILWVVGEGISEQAKLKEGSRAVRLEVTDWPLQKFGGKSNA